MQVSDPLPLEVGLHPAPRLHGIRRRKRLRPFGQGARVAPEGQARMAGQTHPKKPSTSHTSRPLPLPANTAAGRPSGENIRNKYFTMPRLLRWRHGPRRRFAPGPTGIAPKDRVPSWTASASEPTPSACPKTRSARPLEQVIFVILQAHLGVDQAGMKIPAGEYEFQAKHATQV